MKQILKSEVDLPGLIDKIQVQLIELNKKLDILINRSLPQAKPSQILTSPLSSPVAGAHLAVRPNDHHKERIMHAAICADCKKECTIPFKPSPDRPVYCKD